MLSATGANSEKTVGIATRGSSTDPCSFPNCLPEPRKAISRRETELAGRATRENVAL